MEAEAVLAIVGGALTILEKVAPQLQAAMAAGNINPEAQAALKGRVDALRLSAVFSGPEWEIEK